MSRFGARAIFDIAYHSAGLPVQVKDIAKRQEIPQRFLEQIFHRLKMANIVTGVKGPNGGYLLARDPHEITLSDILKAIKEPIDVVYCVHNPNDCSRAPQCVTRLVWKEASARIKQVFDNANMSDLCTSAKEKGLKRGG
jgi:Rrf2 family protein